MSKGPLNSPGVRIILIDETIRIQHDESSTEVEPFLTTRPIPLDLSVQWFIRFDIFSRFEFDPQMFAVLEADPQIIANWEADPFYAEWDVDPQLFARWQVGDPGYMIFANSTSTSTTGGTRAAEVVVLDSTFEVFEGTGLQPELVSAGTFSQPSQIEHVDGPRWVCANIIYIYVTDDNGVSWRRTPFNTVGTAGGGVAVRDFDRWGLTHNTARIGSTDDGGLTFSSILPLDNTTQPNYGRVIFDPITKLYLVAGTYGVRGWSHDLSWNRRGAVWVNWNGQGVASNGVDTLIAVRGTGTTGMRWIRSVNPTRELNNWVSIPNYGDTLIGATSIAYGNGTFVVAMANTTLRKSHDNGDTWDVDIPVPFAGKINYAEYEQKWLLIRSISSSNPVGRTVQLAVSDDLVNWTQYSYFVPLPQFGTTIVDVAGRSPLPFYIEWDLESMDNDNPVANFTIYGGEGNITLQSEESGSANVGFTLNGTQLTATLLDNIHGQHIRTFTIIATDSLGRQRRVGITATFDYLAVHVWSMSAGQRLYYANLEDATQTTLSFSGYSVGTGVPWMAVEGADDGRPEGGKYSVFGFSSGITRWRETSTSGMFVSEIRASMPFTENGIRYFAFFRSSSVYFQVADGANSGFSSAQYSLGVNAFPSSIPTFGRGINNEIIIIRPGQSGFSDINMTSRADIIAGTPFTLVSQIPEATLGAVNMIMPGAGDLLAVSTISSFAHFRRSEDNGATWTTVGSIAPVTTPAAVQGAGLSYRRLMYGNGSWVYFRKQSDVAATSDGVFTSTDRGDTWTRWEPPGSDIGHRAFDVTFYDGLFYAVTGQLLASDLFEFNSMVSGTPISLYTSADGITWTLFRTWDQPASTMFNSITVTIGRLMEW